MADVAQRAGVSLKTVSRVVNHEPHTRDEVIARVRQAIDELGWVPSRGAQAMRTRKTGRIAVVVSDLQLPSIAALAEVVAVEADRRGFSVSIEPTRGDAARASRVMLACGVVHDAAILIGESGADHSAERAVFLQHREGGMDATHVRSDIGQSAGLLVRHVTTMHRRRIALVGRAFDEGGDSLLAHARRELGGDWAVSCDAGGLDLWAGTRAAQLLREAGTDIDAVICESDELALGLLSAFDGDPSAPAVTGFGGTDEGRYATPSLTTIDPHNVRLARLALDAVERLIEGSPAAIDPVPVSLVRRESSMRGAR